MWISAKRSLATYVRAILIVFVHFSGIVQLNLASATPASDVLPVPNETRFLGPPHSHLDPRTDVDWTNYQLHPYPLQAVSPKIVRDHQVNIIELRGWLRSIQRDGNCGDGSGPDISYDLELDPVWDHQAVQLDKLLWIGNIISMGKPYDIDTDRKAMGTPYVHGELHSYDRRKPIGQLVPQPPTEWLPNTPPCQSPDVFWPYNPYKPLPNKPELNEGQYVRMVGSLITDAPHECTGLFCENRGKNWSSGDGKDPTNPARWVEMHSPDLIEVLYENKPRDTTLKGIAVYAPNCGLGTCASETLEAFIPGPQPKPARAWRIRYREVTLRDQRVEEKRVVTENDGIRIRVKVRGESGFGVPGKFAALYVVEWDIAPPPLKKYRLESSQSHLLQARPR